MSGRTRVIVATLWALSLVATAEWAGSAQRPEPPEAEVRFVQSGTAKNGNPVGLLMTNVGGTLKVAELARTGRHIRPLNSGR